MYIKVFSENIPKKLPFFFVVFLKNGRFVPVPCQRITADSCLTEESGDSSKFARKNIAFTRHMLEFSIRNSKI